MNRRPARSRQGGYLYEVPLLMVAVTLIVSLLFPRLPPAGQKGLIGVAALAILFGLYYMIVMPGWMPGDRRLKPPWNLLVFLLVAAAIVAGVMGFMLA